MVDRLGRGFQGEGLHPDHHLGKSWALLEQLGVHGAREFTRRLWLERCLELLGRRDELDAFWQAFAGEPPLASP